MRLAENINELIKKLKLKASADLDMRVNDDISTALAESDKHVLSEVEGTKSAVTQPKIGRIIMKNPITKLAAAAVIIVLVAMGLFEFMGTENTSGVVWADVVRKVGASRGLIFRCTDLSPSNEDDYSTTYTSPRYCRRDFYKDGQITRTCYTDFTG
ncbi:MAG: hypothetical protein JXA81_16640, partial [Sedimentisphaerales bacterium]|nr:hypothetical protein [Sedimentisphaerales bacterium]